ncbi:hypothetical protein FRB90_004615 [Tulasnella sp. 427]|nr:hypothetical protein FRB90_004615 [Tulasnella sp. 427]
MGGLWSLMTHEPQAKDTADGLAYLHGRSPSVIHGDLKGSNVLVNRDRRAILCDFGLSKALSDVPSGLTTTRTVKGTLRYLSPEVLNDEKLSVLSDMWAWGCLAFEILTSLLPYYQVKTENALLLRIASGTKPASLEEHPIPLLVREIVHDCWHFEPHKRPRIHSARKALMFCLPRFDGLDEALDELILSEMSEEMSTDDPTFTETIPDTPENESSYPFATSATPETSAEIDIELVPLRSSVPSRAVRLRPILRKESISGESSDTESILSVISNDGTASANQVSTPTPESPPDFDLPVRRPLVGVYEWLAVEAALLESDDEEQGEEEVNGARPEREEVRVRRHRPGVTFDLSDDDDFATSGDDAIIPSTHFQSSSGTSFLPQSPQIQIPVRSHYPRVSSPPPKPFALSTDSDADSSRPGSPSQSLSPLTSSPISSVPPTRFSPPPQRPPPLPEVAAPIPLTKLSDDLVAQVKDHCRAAAGSVDWQELGPAREHLRAALAILEGTTAEDRHDVVTTS